MMLFKYCNKKFDLETLSNLKVVATKEKLSESSNQINLKSIETSNKKYMEEYLI